MYCGIGFLAYTVTEHCAEEPEPPWQSSNAVAVAHEKALAHDGGGFRAVDYPHADFVAQVIEQPDVVVADEPCYFNPIVGHSGQSAEEACESTWHHGSIFVPIVEDVSEQV